MRRRMRIWRQWRWTWSFGKLGWRLMNPKGKSKTKRAWAGTAHTIVFLFLLLHIHYYITNRCLCILAPSRTQTQTKRISNKTMLPGNSPLNPIHVGDSDFSNIAAWLDHAPPATAAFADLLAALPDLDRAYRTFSSFRSFTPNLNQKINKM